MSEHERLSDSQDEVWLRASFVAARAALDARNAPFGAVLVDAGGRELLRAGNTVHQSGDVTGHAELNAVRVATARFALETLAGATLYASTEPCAMCATSIFMAGIGRVVYGMSGPRLRALTPPPADAPRLDLTCREVAQRGGNRFQVIGPILEDEAERVHLEAAGRG